MGLRRFADMQDCAIWLGDGMVSGIFLGVFHGYAPGRDFVVFTLYAITHIGSLRLVEF